jgi:hypothetical protein
MDGWMERARKGGGVSSSSSSSSWCQASRATRHTFLLVEGHKRSDGSVRHVALQHFVYSSIQVLNLNL